MRGTIAVLFIVCGFIFGGGMSAQEQTGAYKSQPQFLYELRAARVEMVTNGPTEEETAILGEHFAYLQELTGRGVVILAGRTLNNDATAFGIVIFRAESEAAARRILDGDPAVHQGVMRAALYPYDVAALTPEPLPGTPVQKQFLYRVHVIRPEMFTSGPTPAETRTLEQHSAYLRRLTAQGVMILFGRTLSTDESTFGIAIFRAESEAAARQVMLADPAVRDGVMRATLFPYRVALRQTSLD